MLTHAISPLSNFAGHINLEEFIPLIESAKQRIHKEKNRQRVEEAIAGLIEVQAYIAERLKLKEAVKKIDRK